MKTCLILSAALVAVLTGLLLVPSLREHAHLLTVAALALAFITLVLAILPLPSSKVAPAPAAAPPPVAQSNQADAEVISFFALLQEKGRLVDFLMDDVASADDAQVGAAARVVHQGCREVLREHFKIVPVSNAAEGIRLTVPADAAPDEYRLLGKVSGEAPFSGTLIHKGWKTESVRLPRITRPDARRLPVIAPAEVELK